MHASGHGLGGGKGVPGVLFEAVVNAKADSCPATLRHFACWPTGIGHCLGSRIHPNNQALVGMGGMALGAVLG